MRILLVEDAEDLADAVQTRLKRLGYAVEWAADGESALETASRESYDLILLDLTLPRLDGRDVLRALRARKSRVPVLVITAKTATDDKVTLLDMGADDYLVKPFDLRELEARIRALLRRPCGHAASVVNAGNLVFDTAARRVLLDGVEIALGSREFRLLELFLGALGRVLTKNAILDHLYGLDEAVSPNAVELYVSRLRSKLGGASIEIRTVRGEGYVASIVRRP
jgi:two-component system, OmpR family, response regulator TctD